MTFLEAYHTITMKYHACHQLHRSSRYLILLHCLQSCRDLFFGRLLNVQSLLLNAEVVTFLSNRCLLFQLLQHADGLVQKVAFDCIMTYSHKYLTPYRFVGSITYSGTICLLMLVGPSRDMFLIMFCWSFTHRTD